METALFSSCLLGILFLVWYVRYKLKNREFYKMAAKFSGPPTLPIIGDTPKFIMPITEMTDALLESTTRYASPQRFWFGPILVVHVFDPEDLKIILNSQHALSKQPYIYKLVEGITGRGLATSPVEEWRPHRKLLSPCFNTKYIESYAGSFRKNARNLVESLGERCGEGIFDVGDYFVKYAIESIMDTLLGYESGKNSKNTRRLIELLNEMYEVITVRMTNVWYFLDFVYNLSPVGKRAVAIKREYDSFIDSILEKWQSDSMEKRRDPDGSEKSRNLIQHLISATDGNGRLSVEELRGEVTSILTAGLEATSLTLSYTMLMLGIHPEIQERLHEEIVETLGAKDDLEPDDLKNLHLMEMVIKETLRLFPPAIFLGRYSDAEIQLTNHTIPANTTILVGLLALHRNPQIYPEPNLFIPERFSKEEEARRHPYSWLPFSGGPRNCIGLKFGWVSLKMVLVNIIRNFKVETDYKRVEDVHLAMKVRLLPIDGYGIRLSRRY